MLGTTSSSGRSYFETQRDVLVQDIQQTLERVVGHVDQVNLTLGEAANVGQDFAQVALLWNTFYEGGNRGEDEDE